MDATNAPRASERKLQMIIDTIAGLTCQPPPTNEPGASTTDPVKEKPIDKSHVPIAVSVEVRPNGMLKDASVNRLACLFRHWAWADEAMAQFEDQLAAGWEYDEDLLADRPFGAYYHWCALLCGFSESALEHGLLSCAQLEALRPDLEASFPGLRACRDLLVEIPASLEEHPRIVDLLRDDEALGRLRRIHYAFGDALRQERMARKLDWLLYEH